MEYSVAIRTLGKARDNYQRLLNSLMKQTILPSRIIVYIAEGYDLPVETIGVEQYVYVKKGMVAQRALQYKEIDTEYILFLDDDVELSSHSVECLYSALEKYSADVISPDLFPNHQRPFSTKLQMFVSGRMVPRRDDGRWAYKILRTGGFSYNNNPRKNVYESQTNAGPCFFCKKETFLNIHFDQELWLDLVPYALGDDQAMFYKMHILKYKVLTIYNSGIVHLDAGTTLQSYDKERMLAYSDLRFKIIFWYRFIYKVERNFFKRITSVICFSYALLVAYLIAFLKCEWKILHARYEAMQDAVNYIRSAAFKKIDPII